MTRDAMCVRENVCGISVSTNGIGEICAGGLKALQCHRAA